MSVYTENEILSSIDNIDSCVQEAVIDMLGCVIKEYDKLSQIAEFTVFEEAYYTEGKIWDEATGKNTLDGFFKKAILFIPRLLRAIARAIASVFTDKYDEEIKTNGAKAVANLNAMNDPQKLAIANANIFEMSKGEVQLEPKKKHFIFGKTFKHIKNYIRIITGCGPVLTKLRTSIDGGKTSYGEAARSLWRIIKGDGTVEELKGVAGDALFELAADAGNAARGLRGIVDELSMKLEKELQKAQESGADATKQAELKDLMDSISKISATVQHATFFGQVAGFLGKDMGGGSIFLRKIRNATAYDKEEDVAKMNAETEQKTLKSQIMANKRTTAKLKDDTKRLAKKQKEIDKINAKNAKLQAKLDKAAGKTSDAEIAKELQKSKLVTDSAKIDVPDDNEIVDESLEDNFENFAKKMDKYVDRWDDFAFGEPSPKSLERKRRFNNSILARPIGNKERIEYWKQHKDDPDYDALNSYNSYKLNKDNEGKSTVDVMFEK